MDISNLSVNAIRMLGVDAIAKAKSGHPGMVLGSAPMIYSLYSKHLNADPKNPKWFNRDRFVLAAGHASMLLYATLHLCGYDHMTKEEEEEMFALQEEILKKAKIERK